jgi:hypothetical protein
MSTKALFAWLRSLFTPRIPGLPRGVRLATAAECDAVTLAHHQLPVISQICRHGVKSPYSRELEDALWDEYRKAFEAAENDYSCGVALPLIRGGRSGYEPLDIMQKVSDHLVAFLKTREEAAV